MGFPTSDLLQSEMLFYRLTGLASQITKELSDCGATAEVGHTENLKQYVKIPIQGGGAVLLTMDPWFPGAWRLAWPTLGLRVEQSAWPLETPEELLVKIVELTFRHAVHGIALPSPFAWGHPETSRIIELADRLVQQGVDRTCIDLPPLRALNDDGKLLAHPEANQLELTDRGDTPRKLVVRHAPEGWTVDQVMAGTGASGQLNLADSLQVSPMFGITADGDVELENLAEVLVEDTGWSQLDEGPQLFGSRRHQSSKKSLTRTLRGSPHKNGSPGPVSSNVTARLATVPPKSSFSSTGASVRSILPELGGTWNRRREQAHRRRRGPRWVLEARAAVG